MKIKRIVTDIFETDSFITYRLNGHDIWIGMNIAMAGLDNDTGFRTLLYPLCLAIVRDKPGLFADLKNPVVIEFLKATDCIC